MWRVPELKVPLVKHILLTPHNQARHMSPYTRNANPHLAFSSNSFIKPEQIPTQAVLNKELVGNTEKEIESVRMCTNICAVINAQSYSGSGRVGWFLPL